jgi:hypothetical protein
MSPSSTSFLKVAISCIAIAALAVCIFGLPGGLAREAAKTPDTAYLAYVFLVGAYFLFLLFLFAVYQVVKLLTYIGGINAESEACARTVTHIKYSAIVIGASMVAGIAAVMLLTAGTGEDITGIVAPALLVTFASGVVALVAVVFQKRVQKAIDIKKEELS